MRFRGKFSGSTSRKGKKRVVRRRAAARGRRNRLAVANQPMRVQRTLDVIGRSEKKTTANYMNAVPLGQVSGNVDGYVAADLTPLPAQGVLQSNFVGGKFSLQTSYFITTIQGQSAFTQGMKMKWFLIEVKGAPQSVATMIQNAFFGNALISGTNGGTQIIDYDSQFDPQYRSWFKIHARRTFVMQPDNYSSQNYVKTFRVPVRYNGGKGMDIRLTAASTVQSGQLIEVFLCDNGNSSTGTACTLNGVPILPVATGVIVNQSVTHYFIDN